MKNINIKCKILGNEQMFDEHIFDCKKMEISVEQMFGYVGKWKILGNSTR
jgi:hypothetical protein